MNYVEPIRDENKLKEMEQYLLKYSTRNYIMFIIGTNSGLRISDILRLRVRDVKGRENICIREKKTNKQKIFPINGKLKRELQKYCIDKEAEEFLIKSKKGYNKAISREQAYRIIREAGETIGIYNLGTHTLRKTFGYHFYMKYHDVVSLQRIFNHSDPSVTLHYIGIQQSHINKLMKSFKI